MAEKNKLITSTVNAGATSVENYSAAVPTGKIWVIKEFGGADINLGDNKSSIYVLRFGSDILKILTYTGNSGTVLMNEEITGDGVKKVNVVRMNKSGSTKELPFWIKAYERS